MYVWNSSTAYSSAFNNSYMYLHLLHNIWKNTSAIVFTVNVTSIRKPTSSKYRLSPKTSLTETSNKFSHVTTLLFLQDLMKLPWYLILEKKTDLSIIQYQKGTYYCYFLWCNKKQLVFENNCLALVFLSRFSKSIEAGPSLRILLLSVSCNIYCTHRKIFRRIFFGSALGPLHLIIWCRKHSESRNLCFFA